MKKKLFFTASLILSLLLTACALPFSKDPSVSVSISEDTSSDTDTQTSIKLPDKTEPDVDPTADSNTRELTSVEVDLFTKVIMEDYGYGFVETYYSDVRDADLGITPLRLLNVIWLINMALLITLLRLIHHLHLQMTNGNLYLRQHRKLEFLLELIMEVILFTSLKIQLAMRLG